MAGCAALVGCGSSGNKAAVTNGDSSTAAARAERRPVQDGSVVVDPQRVPAAIGRTGLKIVFRPGPTPSAFVRAVYGTARNRLGTSVNFGFFLTGNVSAEGLESEGLRLVPDATQIGSTAGESYVAITSAGSHGGPTGGRVEEEELSMAGELKDAVAYLAPKAFEEEGP
jgi:hypothetical protein